MSFQPNTNSLNNRSVYQYLKSLPHATLNRLYQHPAACLAVFRDMPTLSRLYIMRVLFVDNPVSQVVAASWVVKEKIRYHKEAVRVMSEMYVWQTESLPGGLAGWTMNPVFRAGLKVALLGGGSPWMMSVGCNGQSDKHARDVPFLNQYARERWECVLHYMVGSTDGVSGVSNDIQEILLKSGLMKKGTPTDVEQHITPAGFQFLLLDMPSQVWYFMLQYLNTAMMSGLDIVDQLSFLFKLGFSTLGKDYATDDMTEGQLLFLQHLRELGLVYQRKRKSNRYYPTMLAVNLGQGSVNDSHSVSSTIPGFIIVETNYRVYAYTATSLQIALLALFCEMSYRFPNLAIGSITRDSVREALSRGITAKQMINFLRNHAHPELQKKNPILPSTISDQIQLWEYERDRFQFSEGVVYNQFLSQSDFEMLRDHAKDLGVLTWDNNEMRVMVVKRIAHDQIKKFWKRHKKE